MFYMLSSLDEETDKKGVVLIAFKLADMFTEIEAAKLLIYDAAARKDRNALRDSHR